ncbi:MAG: hypothetical protein HC902_08565 [Calothrix sp. SM1_5_4]|nr:hypothetical protein [Calothrix sp. SM1_5_4]
MINHLALLRLMFRMSLALGVGLWALSAQADPQASLKAKAKTRANVKAASKPQVKDKTKAKTAATATPLDELKLVEGDEQGNEVKSLKAELLVSATEQRAIQQAQKLLKKYKALRSSQRFSSVWLSSTCANRVPIVSSKFTASPRPW